MPPALSFDRAEKLCRSFRGAPVATMSGTKENRAIDVSAAKQTHLLTLFAVIVVC